MSRLKTAVTEDIVSCLSPHDHHVQVRILTEVYPEELCSLAQICQLDGPSGHQDVAAQAQMPFGTWGVSGPQLRECIVSCKLSQAGLQFTMVHIRWDSSQTRLRADAEVLFASGHALEVEAGTWICAACTWRP